MWLLPMKTLFMKTGRLHKRTPPQYPKHSTLGVTHGKVGRRRALKRKARKAGRHISALEMVVMICFDSAESYRQGHFVTNSLNSVLKMGVFYCIL